jgi:phosphatidylserine/phosphatidylglycerophosphate/cardiolipin synthase-like enzyme
MCQPDRRHLRGGDELVTFDDWLLTASERGNDGTEIDRRRDGGAAWTTGNEVAVRIDGAAYFTRLIEAFGELSTGASVWFTDWEGHADERLAGPESEVGRVLGDLVARGVHVRGLLWRSHPRAAHFAEQDNMHLARDINRQGGVLVLDERVRRGGSHHQKLMILRRGPRRLNIAAEPGARPTDVAFIGGIDLCHGRNDSLTHAGDVQPVQLDRRYGSRPPWHDIQLEVRGPAVDDLSYSFRERWGDPSPLDHRNPARTLQRALMRQPRKLPPLPASPSSTLQTGHHVVQVLRTYPSRRPRYRFAPNGERSVARAFLKAVTRARRLVAIEDQYLWSLDAATALAKALTDHESLLVVIVVPRYPDRDGLVAGAANRFARKRVIDTLTKAGGDRVAVFDLENEGGTPIYVHAKVCIIDDIWLEIGSDNLNRRSWTHDSEIACAVLDERLDTRAPTDPGGLGDGARQLARDTRLALWTEHLGRLAGDHDDLIDAAEGFTALRNSARRLDEWHRAGRISDRPPGQLRTHACEPVAAWLRPISAIAYRSVLDPDGRPRALRHAAAY